VLQSANTLLQQQLPADSSLQQLLEPLLPAAVAGSSPASDAGFHSAAGMPGEDVATIAAPSTSLTVGGPMPAAMAAAAAMAATMVVPAPIDVEARAVPSSWGQKAATQQQHSTPGSSPAVQLEQQAAEQRQDSKHWARVVGVCGFAALLCYLDRTNISTAIVPMAEQFGWNKQFCSIIMSAFFAGYGATQVWGGQLSDKYGGSAVLAAGLGVWSLATVLTPLAACWGTWQLLTARAVLGMAQGIAFPAMHALLAKKVRPLSLGDMQRASGLRVTALETLSICCGMSMAVFLDPSDMHDAFVSMLLAHKQHCSPQQSNPTHSFLKLTLICIIPPGLFCAGAQQGAVRCHRHHHGHGTLRYSTRLWREPRPN
jgi:Na+/melibiose symporter-like transporter